MKGDNDMIELMTEQGHLELDRADGNRYFPRCNCGELKVWYIVEMNQKVVHESAVCPKCDEHRVRSLKPHG